MYSHIIHLGDIHIRCGDEANARFHEYETVFYSLTKTLKELPCIQQQSALIALCGDIFHNKYRLEAYSVLLWNTLIHSLTELAPVVIICGNHDYRQEAPDTPDLIDVMMKSFKPTHYSCHYLKDTGLYPFDNIAFGLVSIKDTLNALNTHGTVENLPPYPEPSPHHLNVALFHGTITQSALPNGQYMSTDKGYALEWFNGYDMVLLGDNHKQQTHKSPYGFHWGYPGSLIQQDIGEPVIGHGFLLWDLNTKKPTAHHIYNPYGRMKARFYNGTFAVKLVPNESMVDIETVCDELWFPKTPHFLMLGAIGDEWKIQEYFKGTHITPSSIRSTSTTQFSTSHGMDGTEVPLASSLDTIHQLNNPQMWLDYISSKDATIGNQVSEWNWIHDPKNILMQTVPKSISKELHEMTVKYRGKLEQMIDAYDKITETIRQQRHKVVLKHMSWDWVYSYGLKNWFHFENIQHKVGLLCGKNATGKSAFIDALCIGLFGEPSLNRQLNSSKKMSDDCIHSSRPKNNHTESMNVKVYFTMDNVYYEIERHYQHSAVNMESKNLSMDLYRFDPETNQRTLHCSGSTLVNEWVEQHIGRMEDLLKTSIVSQMDNHNFFFAKPDEQKAMIDSAVNLKELQAFGEIVHEALLNYQALTKTLSTILQTTEERMPTVSPEERKEAQQRWNLLEDRRKVLESRKEDLLGVLGALKHQVPDQTRAYWESRRAPEPQWATRLAELRETKAQLLYEQKTYGYSANTPYSIENDYEAEMARVNKKIEKHRARKPPSSRPLAFLQKEQTRLDAWFKSHQEWIDTIEDHASHLDFVRADHKALEASYEQWAKQKPLALPESVKPMKSDTTVQSEHWTTLVQSYHTLLSQYQEYQTLDASHPKSHWDAWCAEKAEYEQWVEDAQNNEWTDKSSLEKNLRDTKQYINHRQHLAQETERLASQMAEQKDTLQRHGDWKTAYEQWKADCATIPEGETLESIESQLAAMQRLETIQNDPWWKDYAAWKKKYERCIKYEWRSVEAVKAELADYEAEKQHFLENTRAYERYHKERTDFIQSNPHPECPVCQTRVADLTARMDACKDAIGEWTLEKLDAFVLYYQKALAVIQYVETLQESMEATYARYEAEKAALEVTATLAPLADLEARRACHRRVQEGEKYQWLHELDTKYQQLKKQWKKSSQRLEAMESEKDLLETEAYWKNALEVFSKIAYKQPFMERETAAWEAAKEAWEAHPEVSAETLVAAWATAESAWQAAGDDLKTQREAIQANIHALEGFKDALVEHNDQQTRLHTEMEWATAAAEWETRMADLESRLNDLRASQWAWQMQCCLDELAQYEGYELADKWVQWYDFADVQAEYTAVLDEQMHLRASPAMQDLLRASGDGTDGDMSSPYATLKEYAANWGARVNALSLMDKYLVGEKGKKKKDAEDIDTFKEWIYQHHALPMLEERVNEFLQSIDVDLTLRMVYGKRAIKYMVRDRGNETSFAASSGFQQFVIGLGMRHALSNIGGIGNNLQHLFIDEGFTACDLDNIEKAYDILELLIKRGHYQSILLISHLESIQQRVPLKIHLERKDTFTKLAYGEPYPVFANTVKRRGRPPKKPAA